MMIFTMIAGFVRRSAARLICLLGLAATMQLTTARAEKMTVWNSPVAESGSCYGDGFFHIAVDVTCVELKDTVTSVFLTVRQRSDYPGYNFSFGSTSCLRVGDRCFPIVRAEGVELDKPRQTEKDGRLDVVLHFKPLPRDTKVFDFIEGDAEGAFRICGIRPVEERHKMLFPSYWRNEQTGDWEIAFLKDCAIYDCKVWDMKADVDPRTGGADITLKRDGKEVKMIVGKNKKGKRTIEIDGQKALYAMITDRFLPDYPVRDTRTDFVDTDYRVDTATVVGWIKDMPAHYRSDRFFSFGTNDIFLGKQIHYDAELDSMGRFTIRIPLVNSSEFFCDWKRCFIRTMLEPGKTYFLLYDFKEGRRLWMGEDVRLQNELFRFPLDWNVIEMDRGADFDAYIETTDSLLKAQYAAIDDLCRQHPMLSTRFNLYRKDNATWQQAFQFGQARFCTEDFRLPENARKYAYDHFWAKMPKPYTLHRELSSFWRDFIDDASTDHKVLGSFNLLDHIEEIAVSQEEAEKLRIWKERTDEMEENLEAAPNEEEKRLVETAFNEKYGKEMEWLVQLAHSPRVLKMMQENLFIPQLKASMDCLDSLGADPFIKCVWAVRMAENTMEQNHTALSPQMMDALRSWVSNADQWERLQRKNDYYVALSNRQLDKLILNTGKDVVGMTEGEEILKELLEPYKGKVVLIDVWGTWCAPCREALSHSQEEYARLAEYDIQYVYFANNSPTESWENVIKEYNVTGPNVTHFNLLPTQQSAIERYLQINSFPTYKIVDRQGHVLDIKVDARNLEALEELVRTVGGISMQ